MCVARRRRKMLKVEKYETPGSNENSRMNESIEEKIEDGGR